MHILERVDDIAGLDAREKFWIEHFHTTEHRNGYNICGDPKTTRGWKHRSSSRLAMSKNRRKQFGVFNPFFGKKHSPATRIAISKANKGRRQTDEEKSKHRIAHYDRLRAGKDCGTSPVSVMQIDQQTKQVVAEHKSIKSAAKNTGSDCAGISRCCSNKQKSAGGWEWRYL